MEMENVVRQFPNQNVRVCSINVPEGSDGPFRFLWLTGPRAGGRWACLWFSTLRGRIPPKAGHFAQALSLALFAAFRMDQRCAVLHLRRSASRRLQKPFLYVLRTLQGYLDREKREGRYNLPPPPRAGFHRRPLPTVWVACSSHHPRDVLIPAR